MLPGTFQACRDELIKIAEISLHGLSPQTVLSAPKPEVMQTPGLVTAQKVLQKTAEKTRYERFRDHAVPAIGGATLGAWGTGLVSHSPKAHHRAGAALIGALGAMADSHYVNKQKAKRKREAMLKKAAAFGLTPKMQFKATSMVAKKLPGVHQGLGKGPSLKPLHIG